MAKINFPSSPSNGQTYNQNGVYYQYDATIGAWVTSIMSNPFNNGLDTQIIFNDASLPNGSNGMAFSKTANTVYFNNVAVTQNVSANYFRGNGALLTGVASDLTAANNWANTKVDTINSNSTSRIWANSVTVSGIETVYLDLATSGVTATTYGGATAIPAITVDAYGRVTSVSNVTVSAGGLSVNNESSSSSTYYPVFTSNTTGSVAYANVSNTGLYFVPSTGTLSATIFNSLSDITLKTDIKGFDGILLLEDVNPVSFKWKQTGTKSYGVIAQELEKVLPELVETNDSGLKSVSYIPMIAMLIDAVKKQEERIVRLEQLLNAK